MSNDASFEDGQERPLRLKALDADDLSVVSSFTQDAVLRVRDVRWHKKHRRLALLLNRFRWEDAGQAQALGRPVERVQTVLSIHDAIAVKAQGISKDDPELILSILSLTFEPGEDGGGNVVLTLAGDGAFSIKVEALEVLLRDVTRPYVAPSGKAPFHPE